MNDTCHTYRDLLVADSLNELSAAEREAQWRRVAEADFLTEGEKRRMLGLPERPEGA